MKKSLWTLFCYLLWFTMLFSFPCCCLTAAITTTIKWTLTPPHGTYHGGDIAKRLVRLHFQHQPGVIESPFVIIPATPTMEVSAFEYMSMSVNPVRYASYVVMGFHHGDRWLLSQMPIKRGDGPLQRIVDVRIEASHLRIDMVSISVLCVPADHGPEPILWKHDERNTQALMLIDHEGIHYDKQYVELMSDVGEVVEFRIVPNQLVNRR